MKADPSSTTRAPITVGSLLPFLGIAFGLAWGILALYILLPDLMTGVFGRLTGQHPLFYLAVYAPAIAAIVIVVSKGGVAGLRRFFGRLGLWRCPPAWYAFLIVGVPLFFYGGAIIKGNLFTDPFPFSSVPALLLALFLSAIKGPVEEIGWRGFALPLLQRKLAPAWAGLVLGLIWGLWHVPSFLLSGTQQSAWSFAPFFLGTVAISLIMTAVFNSSRGSILLPALFHFQFINPIWPDAQPYDTYLLIPAVVLILLLNRKAMFSRKGAVTEVIPSPGTPEGPARRDPK